MGSGGEQFKQGLEGTTKGAGQALEGLFGGKKKPAGQEPKK
jgi:hypothetical protein